MVHGLLQGFCEAVAVNRCFCKMDRLIDRVLSQVEIMYCGKTQLYITILLCFHFNATGNNVSYQLLDVLLSVQIA